MSKFLKVAGIGVLVALVGLAIAGGTVLASSSATATSTPTPAATPSAPPGGPGGMGFCMVMGQGADWTVFDAAADALDMTAQELFTALHSGKTLSEVAEDQGVDIDTVTKAMQEAWQTIMPKPSDQSGQTPPGGHGQGQGPGGGPGGPGGGPRPTATPES
jgi:DNA-binding NarL/FixJ family response regulator